MYPIFPLSPPPASMEREPFWNTQVLNYDSGVDQAHTGWDKPLYRFSIPWQNMPVSKLNSIEAFWHDRKAFLKPFLFQDPYFNTISAYVMKAGGTAIKTGYMLNNFGHRSFPMSGSISMTSTLSGAYLIGSHYTIDSLTGVVNFVNTVAAADVITINSAGYYLLCRFSAPLRSQSPIWQHFNLPIQIVEILP